MRKKHEQNNGQKPKKFSELKTHKIIKNMKDNRGKDYPTGTAFRVCFVDEESDTVMVQMTDNEEDYRVLSIKLLQNNSTWSTEKQKIEKTLLKNVSQGPAYQNGASIARMR